MRNLKRVLSLALALVMVLGMMVITTSAADYTDAEEITYTEAVEVMSAIGILEGNPDGSFNPQGTLTREQAAKILAYVCLGTDAAEYLTGSTATFDDVAATKWSAKFVAFCKNAKIIDGVGDNKFNPAGTLKTVEFAKMLLVAAGIDGTYTGSGWDANVKAAAEKNGLDVVDIDYSEITREEACEMALAAMKVGVKVTEYVVTTGGEDFVFADMADALLYYTIADDATITKEVYYEDTLLEDVYGVVCYRSTDAFGRPATVYDCNAWNVPMMFVDSPVATYTSKVMGGTLYSKFGRNAVYTRVVDGVPMGSVGGISSGSKAPVAGTDNGVLTEVYRMGKNALGQSVYKIVEVNTYVGKISGYTAEELNDDGEIMVYESVDVTGFTAPVGTMDSNFITGDFTAADKAKGGTVVLYTAAEYEGVYYIQSVKAAESDVVVATWMEAGKSFKADGETYKYSANADSYITAANVNTKAEMIVYVDDYGYAIKVKPVTVKDEYAILLDTATDSTVLFDGAKHYAKLLYVDGTVGVVETDINYSGIAKKSVVKYAEDKGKIVLTNETDYTGALANYVTGNATVVTGSVVADAKTTFVVHTKVGPKDVYTVYTGIASLPAMASANITVMNTQKGIASVVYVDLPAFATAQVKDVVYVVDNAYSVEADVEIGDYYQYNAIVNGKIATVKTAEVELAGFVTNVVVNKDGLITGADPLNGAAPTIVAGTASAIEEASNGIVEIGGTYYAYDANTLVFEANAMSGRFTATDIDSFKIPSTANGNTYAVDFYTVDGILAMIVIAD